ncbi:TonB-dependent receptor plug domain-containing protein [Hyphomicrobium sp. CS1GBMeth3]|uniref:TonB-dependent receptor plug domain-containing protein n=1 Tax=Hyphomicrobium sp. CS1GBMeth3 TaxID=1892845 RepID=UPI001FCD60B2|nr:TonB-dependent receptor plug domain-containing protein [Hyphomicrobium sp. CS1GBMeth3]
MESVQQCGAPMSFAPSLKHVRFGSLLLGVSSLILLLTGAAQAQSPVELDPVKVEAQAAKKKKAAAAKKAAPSSPAPVAPEPEQPPISPEQSRRDAPYRTPASVSSVSFSDLQTYGQVDTGDVLRSVPGTSTRESINNPGIAVNIRGFEGSGRVNMTIDGVRQNFRFTGHEAQGFAYVDPALLAGIDIQRGAVSTAGGAGALAGTANFRTLDIGDIVKPGQTVGALTNVSWGANEAGWSEMVAAGVTNGRVGFAGAISKRDPGNYDNGDGVEVPYTEQDLISGLFGGTQVEVWRCDLRQRIPRQYVSARLALRDLHGQLFVQSDFNRSGEPEGQSLSQQRHDEL